MPVRKPQEILNYLTTQINQLVNARADQLGAKRSDAVWELVQNILGTQEGKAAADLKGRIDSWFYGSQPSIVDLVRVAEATGISTDLLFGIGDPGAIKIEMGTEPSFNQELASLIERTQQQLLLQVRAGSSFAQERLLKLIYEAMKRGVRIELVIADENNDEVLRAIGNRRKYQDPSSEAVRATIKQSRGDIESNARATNTVDNHAIMPIPYAVAHMVFISDRDDDNNASALVLLYNFRELFKNSPMISFRKLDDPILFNFFCDDYDRYKAEYDPPVEQRGI